MNVMGVVRAVLSSVVVKVLGLFVFVGGLVATVGVSGALLDLNVPAWGDFGLAVGLLFVGHFLGSGGLAELGFDKRSLVSVVKHLVAVVAVVFVVAGLVGGYSVAVAYAASSFPFWATLQALVLVVGGGWVARWAHS